MNPVTVDVIAPMPEGWGLCVTCEAFIAQAELESHPADRSTDSFPPDWMEDFKALSTLVIELSKQYGDQVLIRLFDPRSPQGMMKAIQHRVSQYPSFVVGGYGKVVGLKRDQIDRLLEKAGCQRGGAA